MSFSFSRVPYLELADPESVEFKMEICLTLQDWQTLCSQINGYAWPGKDIREKVTHAVCKARKEFGMSTKGDDDD